MPAKQIIFRDEAQAKLLAGINSLAQAVRVARGPVLIHQERIASLPELLPLLQGDAHGAAARVVDRRARAYDRVHDCRLARGEIC